MYKFLIVIWFVLGTSSASFSSTGLPDEISNIQFQNVSQTSVDVVWTTVHPSTSQVMLARDTNYEAERQIPAVADKTLVTSHRVTVDHLLPYITAAGSGQYYIYVASVTGSGQLSTAPSRPYISMRTLATDLAGNPDMRVYTSGPTTVYAGYDAYFAVQPALVAGPLGHLYIKNAGGYNNDSDGVVRSVNTVGPSGAFTPAGAPSAVTHIGVHYICSGVSNPNGIDSVDQFYSATMKLGFCWNGNYLQNHAVRLRVSEDTTPGSRLVTLTLISNGQTVVVNYPINVVRAATAVKSTAKTVTTIPGLANWETQMDKLGRKWCTNRDAADALGNFESWGWQADSWFYDGGRVFQQIDDYEANVLQKPNHAYWQHCAQAVLYPYAYYLAANKGAMQGYSIFSYGMTMNHWRTHNVLMLDAVNALATVGTYHLYQGSIDPWGIRENSYVANMWMANAQLGNAVSPLLQRDIDKLIGNLIMGAEGTGAVGAGVHPFMVGLAAETLSRWYAFSVAAGKPDYRVVPVMKAALDTLWATNWQPAGWFNYNRFTLPVSTTDSSLLNNLNAQGYAWLWYMTGDPTERQHAYDLFSNAFHPASGFDWDGKEFSQEFEFSFDTVRLLQNNGLSYTDHASNSFEGYWPVSTPPIPTKMNCGPTCATGTVASDHATITWTTYVLASSQVVYGTTTAYGKQTVLADTHGVLSHSADLSGLLPATKYHFNVRSVDMMGNASQSSDLTFTTP